MTDEERDREYEVVWSGGPGLVPDRDTKTTGVWSPPRRLYNLSGKYVGKFKEQQEKKALKEANNRLIDIFGED